MPGCPNKTCDTHTHTQTERQRDRETERQTGPAQPDVELRKPSAVSEVESLLLVQGGGGAIPTMFM